MEKITIHVFTIFLFLISFSGCKTDFTRGDGPVEPYAQAKALGKGVCFGNLLESPEEGLWTNGRKIQKSDFDLAKAAGFDSVRLPVCFSCHAQTNAPYTVDDPFMERLDEVLEWGLKKGLRIVIDFHNYLEINESPQEHRERFIAIWRQISKRYSSYPGELFYELLNEPSKNLTATEWNGILADCIVAIRAMDNYHTIIIDCASYASVSGLSGLVIPASETNAIVAFHYYNPSLFLLQGKDYMGSDYATTGIQWPGPPASPLTPAVGVGQWVKDWINDYNTITDSALNPAGPGLIQKEIAMAAQWGADNSRPLWMGEFCAQDGADLVSRVNWTRAVRLELEKYGIPWSIWTLMSDGGSHLYDIESGTWLVDLMGALGLEVPSSE